MQAKRRLVIGGAVLMMLGSACPWATVFGVLPLSGLQCRVGWGTLLAGALLAALEARPAWFSRQLGVLVRHERGVKVGVSALAVLLCVLVMLGVSGGGVLVQTDWGLYLTLLAAVAVIGATLGRTQ
jgi:hypothetical protein